MLESSASHFFNLDVFLFSNFIIYDFFTLSYNPESGTEFISNSARVWDKIAHIGSTQHHP
jgi:hypothetical protein